LKYILSTGLLYLNLRQTYHITRTGEVHFTGTIHDQSAESVTNKGLSVRYFLVQHLEFSKRHKTQSTKNTSPLRCTGRSGDWCTRRGVTFCREALLLVGVGCRVRIQLSPGHFSEDPKWSYLLRAGSLPRSRQHPQGTVRKKTHWVCNQIANASRRMTIVGSWAGCIRFTTRLKNALDSDIEAL